jgi:taurine dioxygenase
LAQHALIVLQGQQISVATHERFAAAFGVPEPHGIVAGLPDSDVIVEIRKETHHRQNFGNAWHFDLSFRTSPPIAAVLVARETPPEGGDTIWANQYQALEELPTHLVAQIEGKLALHSDSAAFGGHKDRKEPRAARHPLILSHPQTGRRSLFVNPVSIESIDGIPQSAARELIDILAAHATQRKFQYRHRWSNGDIVVWDNRATMHKALNDYDGFRRVMHRISVIEDRQSVQITAEADDLKT